MARRKKSKAVVFDHSPAYEVEPGVYADSPYEEPSGPTAEELMHKYGVTWKELDGRRVLNVPSTAPESAVREICAALAAE